MLSKIAHKIFTRFFARRAARFMYRNFATLGLEADKVLPLASSGPRAGFVLLSGLNIPTFHYDIWLNDEWTKQSIRLTSAGELFSFDDDFVDYSSERVAPIVEILKTVAWGYFPFHFTSAFPRTELEARLPPWKG